MLIGLFRVRGHFFGVGLGHHVRQILDVRHGWNLRLLLGHVHLSLGHSSGHRGDLHVDLALGRRHGLGRGRRRRALVLARHFCSRAHLRQARVARAPVAHPAQLGQVHVRGVGLARGQAALQARLLLAERRVAPLAHGASLAGLGGRASDTQARGSAPPKSSLAAPATHAAGARNVVVLVVLFFLVRVDVAHIDGRIALRRGGGELLLAACGCGLYLHGRGHGRDGG
eukprot:TRINITY_DN377_c0_g1_i4.p2 TRINITY_DN377_c0_g1~~TRINITY_DN377_c0_g1_i4.p2  ORF type:complete len:227 (+),score=-29.49 TRINITY_DN377_c0_g1_i4:129-809(+)